MAERPKPKKKEEPEAGEEPKVELHARVCSCGGGAWMLLGKATGAPCTRDGKGSPGGVVLPMGEWRELGKPQCVEDYASASDRRQDTGERREFTRYAARLDVRLSRIKGWNESAASHEDTVTEVIAQGGALVLTHMAVEKNEVLQFEVVPFYKTRAQVLYVNPASEAGGGIRIGVRFLDAPMPENLIPFDAEPLG